MYKVYDCNQQTLSKIEKYPITYTDLFMCSCINDIHEATRHKLAYERRLDTMTDPYLHSNYANLSKCTWPKLIEHHLTRTLHFSVVIYSSKWKQA